MALIICPECGKEYSNRAKNCPNCGCPTEENDSDVNVCTQENDLTTYEKLPRGKVVEHLRMANYNAECIYENSREILKSSNETAKNTALIAYNSERIRRNHRNIGIY